MLIQILFFYNKYHQDFFAFQSTLNEMKLAFLLIQIEPHQFISLNLTNFKVYFYLIFDINHLFKILEQQYPRCPITVSIIKHLYCAL